MSVLEELQATVATQRAILSALEPGCLSGPDAVAMLSVFTEIERLGAAGRRPGAQPVGGANRGAFRTTPDAGARMLVALDAEIERGFKAARREGRREPHQAYAVDALEALVCAGGGGGATRAKPKTEIRVLVDHAALVRG